MRPFPILFALYIAHGASAQMHGLPKETVSTVWALRSLGTGSTALPAAIHLLPRTDHRLTPDIARMPSPWTYHQLGVFCKLDVKLADWLPLPVVMRLGDVQHVDRMEGKGPYRDPR